MTARSSGLYPGLGGKVLSRFMTTPVTLEAYTGNSDGAIVGWAFDGGAHAGGAPDAAGRGRC
jgi:hypothetical protein